MDQRDIEWKSGQVRYWMLDAIDESRPLSTQLEALTEDLAQVEYSPRVVIDLGWYPEFSVGGKFTILVVASENWEAPLFREHCRTTTELKAALAEGVAVAEEVAASGKEET